MVLGQLVEAAVAQPVGAAVADVGHRRRRPRQQQPHDGRPHAVQRAVLADRRQHVVMRLAHRHLEQPRVARQALVAGPDGGGRLVGGRALAGRSRRVHRGQVRRRRSRQGRCASRSGAAGSAAAIAGGSGSSGGSGSVAIAALAAITALPGKGGHRGGGGGGGRRRRSGCKLRVGVGQAQRPGGVAFDRLLDEVMNRLDRDLCRHLAGAVSAHAVGDHVEAVARIDLEVILVVDPSQADVGKAAGFDAQHQLLFPKRPRRGDRDSSSRARWTAGSSSPQSIALRYAAAARSGCPACARMRPATFQ
jgi:hypothetical protein